MRTLMRCLIVAVVVSAVVAAGGGSAVAQRLPGIPPGAALVSVKAGRTVAGVDAALAPGAAITGTVIAAADGTPLGDVDVAVFAGTRLVGGAVTAADGSYRVTGLPASPHGVLVCADPFVAPGEDVTRPSPTGYYGQCYGSSAAWSRHDRPPGDAVAVPVTTGSTQPGIDFELPLGGAISGVIRWPAEPWIEPWVRVYTLSGQLVTAVNTGTDNSSNAYFVTGLAPGSYRVCIQTQPVWDQDPDGGYLSRCYRDVAWGGWEAPVPSRAQPVSVSSGATHAGIDFMLRYGGGITGTVYLTHSSQPINGQLVAAFRDGQVRGFGFSGDQGAGYDHYPGIYHIPGLRAGFRYQVCAIPVMIGSAYPATALTYAHRGQCWKAVAWHGGPLPTAATKVPVQRHSWHGGIDFHLAGPPSGAITGVVRARDGRPLRHVEVTAYGRRGENVRGAVTGSTGRYRLSHLPPSARGYTVCFSGGDARYANTGEQPATGFGNVCFNRQVWNRVTLPVGTTPVPVVGGKVRRGINATLGLAGAIAGHVTFDGTPLANVHVLLTDSRGRIVTDTYPDSTGAYTLTGLSPSATGYHVCFDGWNDQDDPASPLYGFLNQCYKNVFWPGHAGP